MIFARKYSLSDLSVIVKALLVKSVKGTAITNVKLVDIKSLYGAQATEINSLEVHPRWNRQCFNFQSL